VARGPRGGQAASAARADRLAAILGDRLASRDRQRIESWFGDLERGLGSPFAIGLYSEAGAYGAYAVGAAGDGPALRRATSALVDIGKIPAIAAPLSGLAGRIDLKRTESQAAGSGAMTRVRVDITTPASPGAPAAPRRSFEVAAASRTSRAAVVGALGAAGPHLSDLLEPGGMLGADPLVARSVVRAGPGASHAVAFSVHPDGGRPSWAVFTVGSDRHVLWADFAASTATLRALTGALLER
jgi:hypothetical protein